MLLAVGGESRKIVLGEVPPACTEQEQESAQDVAAQWIQETIQEKKNISKERILTSKEIKAPIPQPRLRSTNFIQEKRNNPKNYSQMEKELENNEHVESTDQKMRKLIPVDFDLKLDEDDEYDDDDHTNIGLKNSNCKSDLEHLRCYSIITGKEKKCFSDSWTATKELRLSQSEYHRFCDTQLESYDLATQCPSRKVAARKHAVNKSMIPYLITENVQSRFHNRNKGSISSSVNKTISDSTKNHHSSLKLSVNKRPIPKPRNNFDVKKSDISKDTSNYENIRPTLGELLLEDRLSLTLDEIVHIRNVLTKAELESLPVEGRVKEDVEKRRVCFLCLKTRFGLLGPWGQRCRLCERTVCVKCYSKMRIPTNHFAHVPVILLSPGLLLSSPSSETNSGISKNSWSQCRNSFGSAPTSPAAKRYNSELQNDVSAKISNKVSGVQDLGIPKFLYNSAASLKEGSTCDDKGNIYKPFGSPSKLSNTRTFGTFGRKSIEHERDIDRPHGVSMVVCHDCRLMVIQIIKSSRITRANIRNDVISRLTLDLSPAYI